MNDCLRWRALGVKHGTFGLQGPQAVMARLIYLWFPIVSLLAGYSVIAYAETSSGWGTQNASASEIEATIDQMKAASSLEIRRNLSLQLSDLCMRVDPAVLDAGTIDAIAGFLSDSDDLVRFWAALALGHIGPPARRA